MRSVTFGRPSEHPTPFVVGAPLHQVFGPDAQRLTPYFRPLLTFDSQWVNPAWRGPLHFVYYEPGSATTSRFRVVDGVYAYEGDFREVNEDSPLKSQPLWKFPFVEPIAVRVPERTDSFVVDPSIEELAVSIWKGDPRWQHAANNYRYWKVVERIAREVDGALTTSLMFGGEPSWTQGDETPTSKDGVPMSFVGQIRADLFTDRACDVDLYLFYDSARAIAVQVAQIT